MTDNKRIKLLVNWLISQGTIASQQDLGEKFGVTNKSYLSQLVNGRAFSQDFINKLSALDERINEEWLLTGEGEMLKTQYTQQNYGCEKITQTGNINECQSDALMHALNEISEMRKLLESALNANQRTNDRLLTLLEKDRSV